MPEKGKKKGSTFKSIGKKLRFSFSITSVIILMLIISFLWFGRKKDQLHDVNILLAQIALKIEQAGNIEKAFFLEETINSDFYETHRSKMIEKHKTILGEITKDLHILKKKKDLPDDIAYDAQVLIDDIKHFEELYDELIGLILKRGFKDYGIIGDMRRSIGKITSSGYRLNMVEILSIRRREKDYLLRREAQYVGMLTKHVENVRKSIKRTVTRESSRKRLEDALNNYELLFLELVEIDKSIGIRDGEGLREELESKSLDIEQRAKLIATRANERAESLQTNLEIIGLILFIAFLLTNFLLSYLTTKSLSQPIKELSQSIKQVIESNFSKAPDIAYSDRKDEIGQLSKDFDLVLSKMNTYTAEIVQQKEELGTAYQDIELLSKIGQQISSKIDIKSIIEVVQINLEHLMDVSVFWIGIHDEQKKALNYQGGLLSEKKLTKFSQLLKEENKLGVWCFKSQQEVIINDLEAEAIRYKQFGSVAGENTQSIVYLPLTTKNKPLGVISVQHNEKNFFDELKVDLIRNLATYTVVALDNAILYNTQENTIQERTIKVLEQKEEIKAQKEKLEHSLNNVQLLSEIGKKLTSSLHIEDIAGRMYEQVMHIMDAQVFGIGVFDPESKQLVFKGSIENGKKLAPYSYHTEEDNSFSVWSYNNQKEIHINDLETDLPKYNLSIEKHLQTQEGVPQSILYIPLLSKSKIVGVMGVQSMQQHAYTDDHLYILRNLAIYAVIALENAHNYQQIEHQRNEVQKSSDKITASINYAKRIQDAFLPDITAIQRTLPESFVLFKPRDIVSGDFYWFTEKKNKIFISALDCTGHGVPGAFMSMIGNELLNEAVNRIKLTKPNEILSHLHTGVRIGLRQYETESRDGMDMTLCCIDLEQRTLEFAGANNPLVYMQDGELMVIKGNKYSIGGEQREVKREYTNHTIDISKPTTFYLFSDGYQDQFGGKEGKKFMSKKFRQLLHMIHERPMPEQKALLDKTIQKWQGDIKQIDDILVMGVRV